MLSAKTLQENNRVLLGENILYKAIHFCLICFAPLLLIGQTSENQIEQSEDYPSWTIYRQSKSHYEEEKKYIYFADILKRK